MSANNSDHKSFAGAVSKPYSEKILEERVREFCVAVGAEPAALAPPTFLTVFRAGEFELLERMGIPLAGVLHGEQTYLFNSDVRAGDEITYKTTLTAVHEKKGTRGQMTFLNFETVIEAAGNRTRRVGTSRTTIIVMGEA